MLNGTVSIPSHGLGLSRCSSVQTPQEQHLHYAAPMHACACPYPQHTTSTCNTSTQHDGPRPPWHGRMGSSGSRWRWLQHGSGGGWALMVSPSLGIPMTRPVTVPGFRFWVDEILWSQGRAAVGLVEEVLVAAGGVRTGGPPRAGYSGGPVEDSQALGWRHTRRWEVLWTKSTYAFKAVRVGLVPGQLVSAVCGLNCLTMKKRMLETLKAAYGAQGAWVITPVSFTLPDEVDEWRDWLRCHSKRVQPGWGGSHASRSSSGGDGSCELLWMLKTGQDAGKGLQLLPTSQALALASLPANGTIKRKHSLQVAQLYCHQPMLLEGRKFHLRLWVVVTGYAPLNAYLHKRGLVLFSSEQYQEDSPFEGQFDAASTAATGGSSTAGTSSTTAAGKPQQGYDLQAGPPRIAPGHVTNLARNSSGLVWDLAQLSTRLGAARYATLWKALKRSCTRSLSAARASLRDAHAWLQPPIDCYGFQLLGVDFLLDAAGTPWLLELNSSPSTMTLHDDLPTATLIEATKRAMLQDMVGLIAHRVHQPGGRHVDVNKSQHVPMGEFERLEV